MVLRKLTHSESFLTEPESVANFVKKRKAGHLLIN